MPSRSGTSKKHVRFTRAAGQMGPGPTLPTTHLPSSMPAATQLLDTANEVFPFSVLHKIPMVVLIGADALAFLVAMQQPSLLNRYTLLGFVLGGIIITKESYESFQTAARSIIQQN
jgi:hypothetical protein